MLIQRTFLRRIGLLTLGLVAASALAGCVPTKTINIGAKPEASALIPTAASVAKSSTTQDATPKIVAAANAFIATLSDSEKKTGLFDWTDTAQKQRWSNFPPAGFKRAGLMWRRSDTSARS